MVIRRVSGRQKNFRCQGTAGVTDGRIGNIAPDVAVAPPPLVGPSHWPTVECWYPGGVLRYRQRRFVTFPFPCRLPPAWFASRLPSLRKAESFSTRWQHARRRLIDFRFAFLLGWVWK